MANHKQAEKRNRQRIERTALNRHFRTSMRTQIKRVRAAVGEKDAQAAAAALTVAVPCIDRCAQKGILPAPRASRIVSRLAQSVNALSA